MKIIYLIPLFFISTVLIGNVYATNCIESASCMPTSPVDVLNLYDVWFGSGFTVLIMALIIGTITLAIYARNRSLPMLAILGIYEVAAFGTILTSKYISSQYQTAEYVVGLGIATAVVMLIFRMVKE